MRSFTVQLRLKWIIWLCVLGLVVVSAPHLFLVGFGLRHGLDVSSAIYHLLWEPSQGETMSEDRIPYGEAGVSWLGNIERYEINESSGIAVSQSDPDRLWTHNDSGGTTRIYAVTQSGRDLGYVTLGIPRMGDWEDMASFRLNGESYLLIADVGDNYRWRPRLYLFVIREPGVDDLLKQRTVTPDWVVVFSYPEGYRDCEAVAVDAQEETIYLLSKRTVPAELYRLPLRPAQEEVVAEKIGGVTGIPRPNENDLFEDPQWGKNRSSPTGMDIQGDSAVIVTYKDAYLFQREPGASWSEVLLTIPTRIALPPAYGREAVALTPDGHDFYVSAEREENAATAIFSIRPARGHQRSAGEPSGR
jgi:hypothetical protein